MSAAPSRRTRRRTVAPLLAVALAAGAVSPLAVAPALGKGEPTTDLAIGKTADKLTAAPGETITYTIAVANTGTTAVPVDRIAVSDPMLADLALAGGSKGGSLEPEETLTWTGTHVAGAAECGTLTNTATVSIVKATKSGLHDQYPDNDSASAAVEIAGGACAPVAVIGLAQPAPAPAPAGVQEAVPQSEHAVCPRPRLRTAVTGPRKLAGGEAGLFTITVRNARGAPAARRASLAVRLPWGFALARTPASASLDNGTMRWSLGTLRGHSTRTVQVSLRADRGASGRRALRAGVSARCGAAHASALVRIAQARANQVTPPVTG